jgi:glycine/D-amino acid oxidase-like deaminating enzyme
MTPTRTALIIGGGIAGPSAAMALQKAGIESVIYEAHPTGADGVGVFLTRRGNYSGPVACGLAARAAEQIDNRRRAASYRRERDLTSVAPPVPGRAGGGHRQLAHSGRAWVQSRRSAAWACGARSMAGTWSGISVAFGEAPCDSGGGDDAMC